MPLGLPPGDRTGLLADWVERRVAAELEGFPLARMRRMLRAEGTELAEQELAEDAFDGDEGAEEDIEVRADTVEEAASDQLDVHLDLLRTEIGDRRAVAERVYPFILDDDRVEPLETCGETTYLLLLVLGTAGLPYRTEGRAHEVEEAYDNIALAALRQLLGPPARGVRFARTAAAGLATDYQGVRPTRFPDAISWLRNQLGLGPGTRDPSDQPETVDHWEQDQKDSAPGRQPLTSYNDAGVDVVVWRPFVDGRPGFPVLLVQCTVQLTWEGKLEDINVDLWQRWIDFPTAPPQKALVIPFAETGPVELWTDRTTRAGMIIDRIRLLELLGQMQCAELQALTDERVAEWVRRELSAA